MIKNWFTFGLVHSFMNSISLTKSFKSSKAYTKIFQYIDTWWSVWRDDVYQQWWSVVSRRQSLLKKQRKGDNLKPPTLSKVNYINIELNSKIPNFKQKGYGYKLTSN